MSNYKRRQTTMWRENGKNKVLPVEQVIEVQKTIVNALNMIERIKYKNDPGKRLVTTIKDHLRFVQNQILELKKVEQAKEILMNDDNSNTGC